MERLMEGYSLGYTRGLMRVKQTLSLGLQDDLKRHGKRLSVKTLQAIMDCMIENRETLRENPYSFVRCNEKAKNGFEVYIPKGKELDDHGDSN